MSLFSDVSSDLVQTGFNNNTITKQKETEDWCVAYGKKWIPSNNDNIYKWKIKLNQGAISLIAMGIVSNKHNQNISEDFDSKHSYYLSATGYFRIDGQSATTKLQSAKVGDELCLILNTKQAQLQFYRNGNENHKEILCQITKSANIEYRFALSMYCDNGSVSVTFIDPENNQNEQQEQKEQKKQDNNQEIAALTQKISDLENDNKQKDEQLVQSAQSINTLEVCVVCVYFLPFCVCYVNVF